MIAIFSCLILGGRKEAIPFCSTYQSSERVEPHGFQNNHHRRRIFGLIESYYVIFTLYICHECEIKCDECKGNLKARAKEIVLSIKEVGDRYLEEKLYFYKI